MRIIKLKDKFKVESHKKGEFYKVDVNKPFCSCPHFMFRLIKTGGECKHIKAVKEKYAIKKEAQKKLVRLTKKEEKIINLVRKKGTIDTIELIDKHGDKIINDLIERNELIEEHGKVRVLE